MRCSFCDATLAPGTNYCPQCGTVVRAEADPEFDSAIGEKPSPYAPPPATSIPPDLRPTSNLAIASLVCGIVAWVAFPVLGAIAAVITGHMARKEIRESHFAIQGDWMAILGLVLGYLQIGLIVLVLLVILAIVIIGLLAAAH
ncbi:MAG: DUF4190 domain-containing protein [Isosphaeraceae bacterium]|nr:DUF4190 domain-containing protein [Isosphaeraceae bacterium]